MPIGALTPRAEIHTMWLQVPEDGLRPGTLRRGYTAARWPRRANCFSSHAWGLRKARLPMTAYRGGVERRVGWTQLSGPYQDPAQPPCSARILFGQRLRAEVERQKRS